MIIWEKSKSLRDYLGDKSARIHDSILASEEKRSFIKPRELLQQMQGNGNPRNARTPSRYESAQKTDRWHEQNYRGITFPRKNGGPLLRMPQGRTQEELTWQRQQDGTSKRADANKGNIRS